MGRFLAGSVLLPAWHACWLRGAVPARYIAPRRANDTPLGIAQLLKSPDAQVEMVYIATAPLQGAQGVTVSPQERPHSSFATTVELYITTHTLGAVRTRLFEW
jgi:hypothetical protein